MNEIKPHLISFKLCPFVQRSVITLKEKDIPFDITYIDLKNKPAWFLEISPAGKVPLIRWGEEVLFESAVINEFLDEVYPPSMLPSDPVRKARMRGMIEFTSLLLGLQYSWSMAHTDEAAVRHASDLSGRMAFIESLPQVTAPETDCGFSLLDAAIAPFFMRMKLLLEWRPQWRDTFAPFSGSFAYGDRLLARKSVAGSVVEDFTTLYEEHIRESSSVFLK